MSEPNVWFRAHRIHKHYGKAHTCVNVLRGATLEVAKGEMVSIVGTSGSGKSTLLHVMGLLDTPDQGTVEFAGETLTEQSTARRDRIRNRTFGFVFQFYHLLPELTTLENVLMPLMIRYGYWAWRRVRRAERKRAMTILERMGLAERAKHRPRELSGGEMQRAAIARAILHEPSLLLADEPTGNLDATTGEGILNLLVDLNTRLGLTIVLVTHDQKVACRAHRIVELRGGRLAPADDDQSEPDRTTGSAPGDGDST